jgi:transposase-like protein
MRLTAADFGLPEQVTCPFCERTETELHSAFGSQLSVSTYWCRRCHTAFEYLKARPTPDHGLQLP